jgi:hypothetical protein
MKLYIVKISKKGEASPWSYSSHHVLADTFEEARDKAFAFLSVKFENDSLFDSDGSLNLPKNDTDLLVRAIELVTEDVIH